VVVGGGASVVATALDRLGADVALLAGEGLDGAATAAALERCGEACELIVLEAEAGDPALAAAAEWAVARRSASPPAPPRPVPPLVLLSPTPARDLPAAVWRAAAVAVCNRAEAAALTGIAAADPLEAEDAAVALLGRGPALAVVTLGGEGAVVARAGRATYLPPFTVEVVDPAGAGGCFCAALGVAMLEGLDNFAATGYAMAAAAVAVGRPGTAEAMPTRDDVERMAHSIDLRRDPGTSPVEFPR